MQWFTVTQIVHKVSVVIRLRGRFTTARLLPRLGWVVALVLTCAWVRGAVYEVGPGRGYKSLQDVAGLLGPGDVVTVDGGVTYPGGVSLNDNGDEGTGVITVRGLRVGGRRPVLSGGLAVLRVRGSHYVIEGFDLTSGLDPASKRCFYNVGDDVTLRDCVVHDSKCTGIAGADASGSLTLDGVEVYGCGEGLYAHQIYVGSSVASYPKAVFLMRYCYLHDGAGGNNVKSRVTRNEIEYNWIEGAAYHELDLVGPDPKAQKAPPGIHCDADIIGNVFVKRANSLGTVARFGSDGTAASAGRYHFVNNTVIVQAKKAAGFGLFWLRGEVDSLTVSNNVFWSTVGPMKLVREEGGAAPVLDGDGNWLPVKTAAVPPPWKAITGTDPKFVDAGSDDYRPGADSPLVGAGVVLPGGITARGIPPAHRVPAGTEAVRPQSRERDIGAFPFIVPGSEAPGN